MRRLPWDDRRSFGRGYALGAALVVALAIGADGRTDDVFGASGFAPNRDYFSQLPYEHIDPLTGNLILTFTDLVLPGNAGFDLRIQRTYNSKIYRNYDTSRETLGEDTWVGVGWTLHLGRVFHWNPLDTAGPVVEMPDGSRHQMYPHVDSSGRFISRDFWVFDKGTQTLKLPNGVVYVFQHTANTSGVPGGSAAYATQIRDPFGNYVEAAYWNQTGVSACQNAVAPPDGLCRVTQHLGSQSRQVSFTIETTRSSLATMTYAGHTWTYTPGATDSVGHSLLAQVTPPAGTPWKFQYKATAPFKYELTQLTTPNGGTITYGYDEATFYLGNTSGIDSVVVATRTIGGRDVTPGTWTYAYAQGPTSNQTVITAPACGQPAATTTVSTFFGVEAGSSGPGWKVGLLDKRTVTQGSTVLEEEALLWRTPAFNDRISDQDELVGANRSYEIYVPLVETRTTTRGSSYVTTHTYNSTSYNATGSSFNDYGRPKQIDEQGQLLRSTTRTFEYGFTPYIVDRLATETLTMGSESFAKSYVYRKADGFKTSETIHGIATTFTPEAGTGNVQAVKDARNNQTSFSYDWGVVKNTTTPEYTVSRVINPEGTLQSETRRGFTTSFQYDGAFRLIKRTPPVGNPTAITYDNTLGDKVTQARGSSSVITYLDGFGRVSGTSNAVGVRTNVNYDACGRKSLASLPYDATYLEKDTSFVYDGLDRPIKRTNPDTSIVQYAYSAADGIDVTITDEEGKKSFQDWSAFGDPRDARLMGVAEAFGTGSAQTTSYAYNALGSLTSVTHPTGGGMTGALTRQWTYYAPNYAGSDGKPGLLWKETHPESGEVSYTYDAVGNLASRIDVNGTTTFVSDGNNRLTNADHPGTAYDVTTGWDDSDNRTSVVNSFVSSTFSFDGANRLTQRSDLVNGKTLNTVYTPDANDNIQKITYPSTRQVSYAYDAENRIKTVSNAVTLAAYAQAFSYHPSGQPLSFTAGNGIVHQFTYEANTHRLSTLTEGAAVLKLGYTYDKVGNVKAITDTTTGRTGMNQTYTYDDFHRLKTATGPWPGGSTALAYDSVGNLRSTSIGGSTGFGYDNPRNRIQTASGAYGDSFTYDGYGNLISDATASYTHTPENMVETATAAVGGAITTYRYDGDNARSIKVAGGANHYYVHGPGGMLLGEYTDSGCGSGTTSLRDYMYAGTRLLASVSSLPQVALTAATASVAENVGAAGLSVRLTTPDGCALATDVTVAYATANVTAVAGSDYAGTSGTLTFARGASNGTVQTVTIPLINDGLIEPTETFQLRLSSPSGGVLGTPSLSTITIQDNDTPTISLLPFTSSPPTSGEHLGNATLTIRVTTGDGNNLAEPASVKYSTGAGALPAATAGADFTAIPLTLLTFAAGTPSGTTRTVDVVLKQDALVEANENLKFNLSTPVKAVLGTASVNIQIMDDEPTVALTAASSSLAEDAGVAPIVVKILTKPGFPLTTAGLVTVKYATANGTALAGSDYVVTSGTLTFPAGSADGATQSINVPIVDDSLGEKDETLTVRLSTPTGAALGNVIAHTVTIRDNDTPTVSLLPFTSSPATSGENLGKATVTIQITTLAGTPIGAAASVKYATAAGALPAATATADFTAIPLTTLTFPAGTPSGTTRTVDVIIKQDALVEANENLKFNLSAPVGTLLGTSSVNIQIMDDEPTVEFVTSSSLVMENAGPASVEVKLLTKPGFPLATAGPVTVRYATANGTALAGSDYVTTTGVLTFPAGTANGTTLSAIAALINDLIKENQETFTLRLSAPTGAALGGVTAHTVTLRDDDAPTISLLPFVSSPATSGEHLGKATVTVEMTTGDGQPLAAPASIKYVTAAGALPAATATADFTAIPLTTLTFAAGTTSGATRTVDVVIKQDALVEVDENLKFNLSGPVGAVLGTSSVNIQIMDDEPTVGFTLAASSVAEDAGPASVEVKLLTKPGFPLTTAGAATVRYATAAGTALAGSDYTTTSGTLSFPAGTANEAVQTISVPIVRDAVTEPAETFKVNLSAPVGVALGTVRSHTVTIVPAALRTAIDTVPYVIEEPGEYVLARDLESDLSQGAAILVAADSVVLDLAGFSLKSTVGPDSQAVGISALGRQDVTVRNGTVRGFLTGVKLEEGERYVVEGVLGLESRQSGLEVCGRESLVRGNRVVDTGLGGQPAWGVVACGAGTRVLENDVLDMAGEAPHGIEVRLAPGASVAGNRVGVSRATFGVGIVVLDSEGVSLTGNRVTGAGRGIALEGSTANCSGNVSSGVGEAGECAEVQQ